ncbi:MAG TPA: peptidylprolyl isomerase [Devosia sp.]|nr:peptidylprolyl isomerase [Devosia sp.]
MSLFKRLAAFAGVFAAIATLAGSAPAQSGTPHWMLTLKDGVVDIELLPNVAPLHVERIVTLTERGDYDNVVFHRVIEDFMAQSGDVRFGKEGSAGFDMNMVGTGDSDLPNVKAEFNAESFTRGAVGAARTNDPDTFNSQFFICFKDCTFLDGQYTVFGRVVSGMEFVDNITRGEPPASPDKIISAKIEYK